MTSGKARNGRRAALGLALAASLWLLTVWPTPIWWRDHWPNRTAMMRSPEHRAGQSPAYRPTPLADIGGDLQRMIVIAEDSRFRSHRGVDFQEIRDAAGVPSNGGLWRAVAPVWRRRDRVRGASTITQQLAKNLYLSSSRSLLRKLKEAVTAVHLEAALSKDRILELYLNVVEWGPGIWGVDDASRAYFGVPPSRLDTWQAASLAATLPHPRASNPAYQPARMALRRDLILARYYGADIVIPRLDDPLDELPRIEIDPPLLPLPPALESLLIDTTAETPPQSTSRSGITSDR